MAKFNLYTSNACSHLGEITKERSACQGGTVYRCNKLAIEVTTNYCKDYFSCGGRWDSRIPCEFYEASGSPAPKSKKAEFAAEQKSARQTKEVVPLKTLGEVDLKTFFDGVYLINLDRRPDRLTSAMAEIARDWPFSQPRRISAFDGSSQTPPDWWKGPPGAWGCLQSHLFVLGEAIRDGKQQILILEDDLRIVKNFSNLAKTFLKSVPENWDGIHFGGHHVHQPWKLESIEPTVRKSVKTYLTHAFALKMPAMKKIFDFWSNPKVTNTHLDICLARVMGGKFNFYSPASWLIYQNGSQSDINKRGE